MFAMIEKAYVLLGIKPSYSTPETEGASMPDPAVPHPCPAHRCPEDAEEDAGFAFSIESTTLKLPLVRWDYGMQTQHAIGPSCCQSDTLTDVATVYLPLCRGISTAAAAARRGRLRRHGG